MKRDATSQWIVNKIAFIKRMNREDPQFKRVIEPMLLRFLHQMRTITLFIENIELLRLPYDKNNAEHEAKLENLWERLRPDIRRTGGRVTKEWQELGFQGTDPATDFRGMGYLGLHNLHYFAEYHSPAALKIVGDALTKPNWFSMAITGINLTGDLVTLIKQRKLNTWFHYQG